MQFLSRRSITVAIVLTLAALISSLCVVRLKGSRPQALSSASAGPAVELAALNVKLAALPDVVPKPDQFVYIQMHTSGSSNLSQFWLSVDGTHDGFMIRPDLAKLTGGTGRIAIPGCVNGKRPVVRGETTLKMTEDCVPTVAYDANLPVDSGAMTSLLSSVGANASKDPTEGANAQGKYVLNTLEFMYLSRNQRSALVSAAKALPGLTVQAGARDVAGRTGLALKWQDKVTGSSNTIVLDSDTGQYLGTPQGDSIEAMNVVASVGATQ